MRAEFILIFVFFCCFAGGVARARICLLSLVCVLSLARVLSLA
jgi:hypothetical protein